MGQQGAVWEGRRRDEELLRGHRHSAYSGERLMLSPAPATLSLLKDGLFSAVVSAFIVLAVTLLRPDKAEAAVTLLSNISTQLSSLKITPPFINSTAQDMATTDPSDKLASARGFNILWFFGLLLSLTSAVLGILAKQWIREYLQWKQPTATPRDNVLVRQIRRESWDGLYAASIISLVPFLLEIAIIFFLGGTFAFLNSILIDRVVQIIVSVVIAASLALIIVVIILPIYYQRSPYRSPTMLVILVLATWLSRTSTPSDETPPAPALPPTPAPLLTPLQHAAPPNDVPLPITFDDHFKRQHTTNYNHLKENLIWRFNDLTGADLARGKLRHQSRGQAGEGQSKNRGGTIGAACSVLLEELKLELEGDSGIDNMKTYLNNLPPNSDVVGTYTTALGESDLLFRALVLLVADSNTPDGAILRQLPYCVETIFPSLNCLELFSPLKVEGTRDSEMVIGGGFQSLSIWYMLSRVRATGAGHMGSFVDHPLCQNYSIAEYVLLLLRDKISRNGVPEEAHGAPDDPHGAPGDPHDALEDPNYMTFLGPEQDRLRTIYEVTERRLAEAQLIVISYVFACGLRARVEEALYYCTRLKSNTNPVVAVLERRMRELLYAMIFTTFRWDIGTRLWRLCLQDCAEILARAFNAVAVHKHKKDFEALFPELQHLVLEVLSDRFPVHFGPRRRLHVMSLLPGTPLARYP